MNRYSIALPLLASLAMGVSYGALAAEGGNWAGPYAGVHLGYGNGSDESVTTTGQLAGNIANVAGGARPPSVSVDANGFVGGALAGFNIQSGTFVYGVEADLDYTDIEESTTVGTLSLATAVPPLAPLSNTFEQDLNYLGTLRLRAGIDMQNTLVYATGGFAFGGIDNQVNFTNAAGVTQFTGSDDDTEWGYAVGGGVEHIINGPWRITGSYLYYDLGDQTTNVAGVPGVGVGGYNSEFETKGHLFRAGFNYKF